MGSVDKKLNFDFSFLGKENLPNDKTNAQQIEVQNDKNKQITDKSVNVENKKPPFNLTKVVAIIIIVACVIISVNNIVEKQKAEIQAQENIVYSYYKNKDLKNYKISAECLSQLTRKSLAEIDYEMSNKYNNELDNVLREIANSWENDKSLFIDLKRKYLPVYFNNDEKLFNSMVEEKIGYKSITLKEMAMPRSGIMRNYTGEPLIAPFAIKTSSGDINSYYIKLVDYYTGELAVTLFVRAGESIRVNIPLGDYLIKYAAGEIWYGQQDLFGHKTNFVKSDERLSFTSDGYRVSGHTLTLYRVQNGNFSTQNIDTNDF